MSPTPRLAALVAVAALAAIVVPAALAILALAAIAGALVVDARAAREAPAVERRLPPLFVRGRAASVEAAVTSRARERVLLRQAATPALEVHPREGSGELHADVVARRRGRHELPRLAARSEGPLGLARWYRTVAPAEEVEVFPDVPNARRLALAVRAGRFAEYAGRSPGPLGLGTDFESIRQYVPDDDIRRVNWRATARTGRPMSNQYRIEQEREIVCLIDCGRLMAAPSGAPHGADRLDTALDAAIAVGLVADVLGDRFGAIAFDSEVRAILRPRRRGGEVTVRALFDLRPRPIDSDFELAMRHVSGSKRALVLVMTDFLDEIAARSLVDAVPALARRHAVVVASVRDPDLDALLTTRPAAAADVYATIGALDVVHGRERAAALVRHAGATVIDAAPAALPEACVRAYLRSKSRARL